MGSAVSNPLTVGDAVKLQKEKIEEAHIIMNRGVNNHSKSGLERHEKAAKQTEELASNAVKVLDVSRCSTKNVDDALIQHKVTWDQEEITLLADGLKAENSANKDLQPLVKNYVNREINKLKSQLEILQAEAQDAADEAKRVLQQLDVHVQKKLPEFQQKSQAAVDAFQKDCEAVRTKVQEAENEANKRINALMDEITKLDAKMIANVQAVEDEQRQTDQIVRDQIKLVDEAARQALTKAQALVTTRDNCFNQTSHDVLMAVENASRLEEDVAV